MESTYSSKVGVNGEVGVDSEGQENGWFKGQIGRTTNIL